MAPSGLPSYEELAARLAAVEGRLNDVQGLRQSMEHTWDPRGGEPRIVDGAGNTLPYVPALEFAGATVTLSNAKQRAIISVPAGVNGATVGETVSVMSFDTTTNVTSGTIYSMMCHMEAGQVADGAMVCAALPGSLFTGTIRMGLANESRVMVARTRDLDQAADWPAAGFIKHTFETPYTAAVAGPHLLTYIQAGSWTASPSSLYRLPSTHPPPHGSVYPPGGTTRRWAAHGTGKTDLPALGVALDAGVQEVQPIWLAVTFAP